MTFEITQGDTSPALVSQLTAGGEPIDLSSVDDVKFIMQDKYERIVIDEGVQESVNILNASNGEVEFVFRRDNTNTVGSYEAQFEVTYSNGAVETFPSDKRIDIEIVEQIA
jgi:hypothetical protein